MAGLIGQCLFAKDTYRAAGTAMDISLWVCFNELGVNITDSAGVVLQHGQYLGYSGAEKVFGFARGAPCSRGGVPVQRAAKVKVGCCSITAMYASYLGKPSQIGLRHSCQPVWPDPALVLSLLNICTGNLSACNAHAWHANKVTVPTWAALAHALPAMLPCHCDIPGVVPPSAGLSVCLPACR